MTWESESHEDRLSTSTKKQPPPPITNYISNIALMNLSSKNGSLTVKHFSSKTVNQK